MASIIFTVNTTGNLAGIIFGKNRECIRQADGARGLLEKFTFFKRTLSFLGFVWGSVEG